MLELKNIHKYFQDFLIKDINLTVNKGDYYIILGKSGSGKTILLETIAGILSADKGEIWLNNKDIAHSKIQERKVGLVFQDYAVFPHKTVFQNIAYALRKKKTRRALKDEVHELARRTGVEHLLHRYPDSLSGGEVQRTVLARALALEPEILLLDEPLTSLDVQYKKELQALLRKLNEEGQTIIHVTHDYEEALALANRVAVMNDGEVVQEGEVHEVFRNPRNKFIADFVGIRNFFVADIEPLPDSSYIKAQVSRNISFYTTGTVSREEKKVVIIDASGIIISEYQIKSTALNNFSGVIKDVIPIVQGLEIIVDIGVDMAVIITEESYQRLSLSKGRTVWISFKASSVHIQDY